MVENQYLFCMQLRIEKFKMTLISFIMRPRAQA